MRKHLLRLQDNNMNLYSIVSVLTLQYVSYTIVIDFILQNDVVTRSVDFVVFDEHTIPSASCRTHTHYNVRLSL